jgi:hypothetical protein
MDASLMSRPSVPTAEDPDVLEASMLLYSLKWTLEQVEGKLAPSAQ